MHIKFLSHGQGSAAGAVRYLLQEHDHNGEVRAEVTVLRGDPSMVAQVADATTHQWRYTSGIISWAPDDNPTPAEIQAVIEDWEATAFAGLDADQYASCAVLHRDDDGTPHIHTLTARVELTTGKSLNIAPPSHQKTFDPLRDYWNHRMGWARPDDPDRARSVQLGHESRGRSKPDKHPKNRKEITDYIEALVVEGLLTNAQEIRQELAEIGEITRASHAYVSVKPHGEEKTIRLKGDLFRDNWTIESELERAARRAQSEAAGRDGRADPEAAKRARERLETVTERRAAYNRERYSESERTPQQGAERRRGTAWPADREHRGAFSQSSGSGGATEPNRRAAELGAPGSDHGGGNADRGRRDSRWATDSRPTDRQQSGAIGSAEYRDRAGPGDAEAAPGRGGSHVERWADISDRDRPRNRMGGDAERRYAGDQADKPGGLTNDGVGNSAFEAVRAAAARLRGASQRAVSTARALADSVERAAERKPNFATGTAGERPEKRGAFQRSDAARELFERSARAFHERSEGVKTAYQAWMARQQERERQDFERERRRRAQYVPPALRDAFAEQKPEQPETEPQKPKSRKWMPNTDGPGF